jgi:ATP phosphoribosyltransferase
MTPEDSSLKMLLPKGRIQENVLKLLNSVGLHFSFSSRSYRPSSSDSSVEAKLLKAQNIPMLIALGRHDCGFTGLDWVMEQKADVVELMDLKYDPVKIVAAIPEALAADFKSGKLKAEKLVVASEYRTLSLNYIQQTCPNAVFIQTYGATEALPPEDADLIIDNTATGTTLRLNRLEIVSELMRSTTRFICSKQALENPVKRKKLEELCMLMQSTQNASQKVLLEMNVLKEQFETVVSSLPAMRAPTVSPLYNEEGFAIKVAVNTSEVPHLIPRDILEYKLEKIVV